MLLLQANLFIGLGLLSTAYALKLGGWMALVGLAANAACFATAGEILEQLSRISASLDAWLWHCCHQLQTLPACYITAIVFSVVSAMQHADDIHRCNACI